MTNLILQCFKKKGVIRGPKGCWVEEAKDREGAGASDDMEPTQNFVKSSFSGKVGANGTSRRMNGWMSEEGREPV